VLIFAATNKYLDDVELKNCRKFESELNRYLDNSAQQLMASIREKKVLDDEIKAALHKVLKEFKDQLVF
jgi:F-type H+-transporting ATPase subunit alpha